MRLLFLLIISLLMLPLFVLADEKPKAKTPPRILYSIPLVAKSESTNTLTVKGSNLETVTEVKSGNKDVTVKLKKKGQKAAVPNNNYPANKLGDTECELEVIIPKGFKDNSIELKAVSSDGESLPFRLMIAKDSTKENEPNGGFAQAQKIQTPATIESSIGREKDVDLFQFEAKAGAKIAAEIQAATLGSPASLRLTLFSKSFETIMEVDSTTKQLDPAIKYTIKQDGIYYLMVQELNDLGGPQFGYRLLFK